MKEREERSGGDKKEMRRVSSFTTGYASRNRALHRIPYKQPTNWVRELMKAEEAVSERINFTLWDEASQIIQRFKALLVPS